MTLVSRPSMLPERWGFAVVFLLIGAANVQALWNDAESPFWRIVLGAGAVTLLALALTVLRRLPSLVARVHDAGDALVLGDGPTAARVPYAAIRSATFGLTTGDACGTVTVVADVDGQKRRFRFAPADAGTPGSPWRRYLPSSGVPHSARVLLGRLSAAGVPVASTDNWLRRPAEHHS